MAILLFDENNLVNIPTLIVESKGGKRYGSITNFTDLIYKNQLNAANEISFTVFKYENEKINYIWEYLSDLKTIYIPEYNEKFQISVSYYDEVNETKSISGISLCEAELGQIYLRNFECNTDDDLELHDYKITKFYDPVNTELSLLHRVLHDKVSHYKIGFVSETLKNLSYEFSTDEKSIYDFLTGDVAEQLHCIFEFDSMTRTINVYDLYSTCNNCKEEIIGKNESDYPKYRDDFHDICPKCGSTNIIEGYGKDTTILIDRYNLSTSIKKDADIGSLKNCLFVEGGDDNINAAFILANPNGSQYVYYFSPELLSEMPEEFVDAYDSYNKLYNKYYYGSNEPIIDSKNTTHIINAEGKMSSINFDANKPDSNYIMSFNNVIDEITSLSTDAPYSDFLTYKSNYVFKNQSELVTAYYNAIDFESFIQTKMMPTYEMEEYNKYHALSLLTSNNIGTIGIPNFGDYTVKTIVENAILQAVKSIINTALFNVDIYTSNYTSGSSIWEGTFIITDLLNNDDATNSITNENYQHIATKEGYTVTDTIYSSISLTINGDFISYAKNRINYILSKKDLPTAIDLYKPSLSYEDFVFKIAYHSSDNLTLFYNVLTSCRDVLQEVKENITDTTNAVYKKILEYDANYCSKMEAINELIAVREGQINNVHNFSSLLYSYITDIQKKLNFKSYLENYATEHKLTTSLWDIFNYYRRETTYKNENIISDSLNTNSDLLKYAGYLMDFAKKEAVKVGTPQFTISSTLNNLLMIPEFQPILNDFEVGNWIRVKTDIQDEHDEDFIYKLRLLSYTVKYDSLEQIEVEFSTAFQTWSGLRDISEIIKSAQSTATSITSIAQQIDKNNGTFNIVANWVNNGLDLTNQMIMSDANNQSLVIDEHGLLARKYYDLTDTYDDCQLKIFNNGLYTTHDGWKTIDTGVGKICYTDPETGEKIVDYGVIAKTIIGKLLIGEQLKIYGANSSIVLDQEGITLDGGRIKWKSKLPREAVDGLDTTLNNFVEKTVYNQDVQKIQNQIDGNITTWFYDYTPTDTNEPSVNWKTKEEKITHEGDLFYCTDIKNAHAYRYIYDTTSETHKWILIEDTDVTKALADAAKAQDTADCKRRVFVIQPTPPYDDGDLWVQGEDGDIMRCRFSRQEGTYDPSDWIKASKYTDDSELNKYKKEILKFQNKVNTALTGDTTDIGDDYVISPKIGGGYLYIANQYDKRSVTIDPEQTYCDNGYIFCVTNKSGKTVIGADSNGNAYFSGELSAATGTFSGSLSSNVILLNSNSVENCGRISLTTLAESDGETYKCISLINDYASDSDNVSISLGFKNTDTSKFYSTSGFATVKKNGSIYNKLYSNTYLGESTTSFIGLSSASYNGLFASNAIHTPRVFAGNYVHGDYSLDVNGNSYFSGSMSLSNGSYINASSLGGAYFSDKIFTQSSISIGNINPGDNMLYVNGKTYINDQIVIEGFLTSKGSLKKPYDGAPNLKITSNGVIGITTGSSKRFKTDIIELNDESLNPHHLYDINIMQYKFKKDYLEEDQQRFGQDVIGFIAEDVFEKYPVAADYSIDSDGHVIVNDWNFRYLLPAMLKLIQEQKEQLDLLEKKIES